MSASLRAFGALLCGTLIGAKCGDRDAAKSVSAASAETPSPAANLDLCSLLTPAEIAEVTGTKVTEGKPQSYGETATCNFTAADGFMPVATLVLAQRMPKVGSSAELAEWRLGTAQGSSYAGMEFKVAPVEGLGVPAISNEVEGTGLVAVECAAKGMLLDVSTAKLDHSKALAAKALARLP